MKQYLLPQNGNFYKANLHCHTTVSTGKLTPEEVKDIYKSKDYAIVAYTDHDIMIDQSHLADESFLPLLGYEIEITEDDEDDLKPMDINISGIEDMPDLPVDEDGKDEEEDEFGEEDDFGGDEDFGEFDEGSLRDDDGGLDDLLGDLSDGIDSDDLDLD